MIGVIADFLEHEVVREFFELFKTPWEFYRTGRTYDVVLCATDEGFHGNAKLVLVYGGAKRHLESVKTTGYTCQRSHNRILSYAGYRIPIYGDAITFPEKQSWLLEDEESQEPAAYLEQRGESAQVRVGYDLFKEVRTLLTTGQPVANAATPALELHIALLRDFVVGCGIHLVEIPPVPEGYRFIVCLTHDVDHPCIRQHKWDHTIFGFLHRAVFGSFFRLLTGRISIRDLAKNWFAALKLPFVHVGLAKDFWSDFGDRYLQLENGLPSTFFLIPFKKYPGNHCDARAAKLRGARYSAAELSSTINKLKRAGCEIGLHGIDAWCDSAKARTELAAIHRLTGAREVGVRMHWLFYDDQSPEALEEGGAAYDSTVGYNDTVGYRAGTTQAFKPFTAKQLHELPMHVMDTALFYPAYLNLSRWEGKRAVEVLADNAQKFGGCITINWHDRSLAPERLWGDCYREIVEDLGDRGAWFATVGECVAWFRKRRSATFANSGTELSNTAVNTTGSCNRVPELQLRIHSKRDSYPPTGSTPSDYAKDRLGRGVDLRNQVYTAPSK